jgi:hypothetical protein
MPAAMAILLSVPRAGGDGPYTLDGYELLLPILSRRQG